MLTELPLWVLSILNVHWVPIVSVQHSMLTELPLWVLSILHAPLVLIMSAQHTSGSLSSHYQCSAYFMLTELPLWVLSKHHDHWAPTMSAQHTPWSLSSHCELSAYFMLTELPLWVSAYFVLTELYYECLAYFWLTELKLWVFSILHAHWASIMSAPIVSTQLTSSSLSSHYWCSSAQHIYAHHACWFWVIRCIEQCFAPFHYFCPR